MTDWREHFPDDSRVSWERRLADETGSLWPIAELFVAAWRRDNSLVEARMLEAHVAAQAGVELAAFPAVSELSGRQGAAVDAAIAATRRILRRGGVQQLRLFRGQQAPLGLVVGEEIDVSGRGLTAWSPLREVAVGHAGRRRPAVVVEADVTVGQVALAYDPSSDGEIVLTGLVAATVDTLIA